MTPRDYVQHHLSHAHVGHGFWTINVDSVIISSFVALSTLALLWCVSVHVQRQPGRWQVFFEMILESMVLKAIRGFNVAYIPVIGPLAFSLFCYIFALCSMSLVPIDIGTMVSHALHIHDEFQFSPTADINVCLGLSLFAVCYMNIGAIKVHGLKTYLSSILCHPFGSYCMPFNVLMKVVDDVAHFASLGVRLFGNFFVGELVFVVLAVFPSPAHWFGGVAWALYHILVIFIQSYIFTTLTIIFFSMTIDH